MKPHINITNDIGQRHGLWIVYDNGNLWFKGQFINDKEYGYWISNWSMFKSQMIFYLT